jgi:hypothetical protein
MAVEEGIKESERSHGWGVLSHEHPWSDNRRDSGYADLLIRKRFEESVPHVVAIAVIECKKRQQEAWVFQVDAASAQPREEIVTLGIQPRPSGATQAWGVCKLAPATIEAEYCAVGTGGDRRILERWLGGLLSSVGALGNQLHSSGVASRTNETVFVFVPVLVTTAQLVICRVEKAGVDLESGRLKAGAFEIVPWLRFHKPLSQPMVQGDDLATLRRKTERTVLIVNAGRVTDVLAGWSLRHTRWGLS